MGIRTNYKYLPFAFQINTAAYRSGNQKNSFSFSNELYSILI